LSIVVPGETIMAAMTLRGPYRLASGVIDNLVPAGSTGVYALGATTPAGLYSVDAIGRAERNLAETLAGLVGSNSEFMFATSSSVAENFEMECRLYHVNLFAGRRPHPVPPADTNLRCQICGKSD
jgi:hypothetical protein